MDIKAKDIRLVDVESLVPLKNFYRLTQTHLEIFILDQTGSYHTCLVDYSDLPKINKYKWRGQKNTENYVAVVATVSGGTVLMSRTIVKPKKEMFIDHKNGNPLDNRSSNLRVCTHQENMFNKKKADFKKYKGVYLDKSRGKWVAQLTLNGKTKSLGRYNTELEAAIAYDEAAKVIQGEFAKLNFA